MAFSPDGNCLATVGGLISVHPDREIKLWDAHTGQGDPQACAAMWAGSAAWLSAPTGAASRQPDWIKTSGSGTQRPGKRSSRCAATSTTFGV